MEQTRVAESDAVYLKLDFAYLAMPVIAAALTVAPTPADPTGTSLLRLMSPLLPNFVMRRNPTR